MAAAKTNTAGRDRITEYHQQFADSIIKQIEAGTAPWQKPWKSGQRFLPENALSGQPYRGGNALYLALTGQGRGFADNRWATYRQIAQAGGHVKKGERGEKILYFDTTKLSPQKDENGRQVLDNDGRPVYERHERGRAFVRTYTVFNVEQTRGLDLPAREATVADWQAHQSAEAVIDAANVTIKHSPGDRAYYAPKSDQIVLPERAQFPSAEHYYATALHELSHATGHESRLNREVFQKGVAAGFGTPEYAREELRAEISAMMTGERIGIGHTPKGAMATAPPTSRVGSRHSRTTRGRSTAPPAKPSAFPATWWSPLASASSRSAGTSRLLWMRRRCAFRNFRLRRPRGSSRT